MPSRNDLIALSRRHRGILMLLLSLLLIGMQHEGFRHALEHFKSAPARQELSSPESGTVCVECALLAAGSTALPSGAPVVSAGASAGAIIVSVLSEPTLARLSFYRSRAPPSLS